METKSNKGQRVVVTGLGLLSPLGPFDEFWSNLLEGKSGIRKTTLFDPEDLEVRVAAGLSADGPVIPPFRCTAAWASSSRRTTEASLGRSSSTAPPPG